VPIIIYNIPYRTGRALGSAALLELAATDNIVGVKQSVGAVDIDTLTLLRDAPRGFHVLSGEDALIFPLVVMGACGGITASSHVCTARFVELVECGLAGKLDDGRAHAEALLPVVRTGFVEPNPAVFKGVMHAQGRIASPALRLPMTAASQPVIDACLAAVAAAG
jgi:4-hydroxy-tetrahydrodipicolinate synthase